jgi:hypothetical protein
MQAEAVRQAEAAARALDAPKADAAPEVAQAGETARELAGRLADRLSPRAEAHALARAERSLEESDPVGQSRQSRDLAAQAARLEMQARSEQGAKPPSNPSEAAARVAELSERALHPSNDPNRPTPTGADLAAAEAEAAAGLDKLAEHLPDAPPLANASPRERKLPDAPRDPALDPLRARGDEAKALARRERRLRERLQSVLGERVPPQEDLRREASALGQELADLRERSREPGPSGRGHADAAAELLNNHAARQMIQALDELAQGRPDQARDAQRQAAEFVERAGQSADDLAHALRRDRPAEALPADLAPAREALAEARRRLAEPGQGQGQGRGQMPGPSASSAMQRAAQAMRTAAQSAPGPGQGEPGDEPAMADGGSTKDPKSNPAGVAASDLSGLPAMARTKSAHNWGELPGHLRTEIMQLSQGKYRDDYARQIRLYFKEIAADGAKSDPK